MIEASSTWIGYVFFGDRSVERVVLVLLAGSFLGDGGRTSTDNVRGVVSSIELVLGARYRRVVGDLRYPCNR